jgi:hypothetical protein
MGQAMRVWHHRMPHSFVRPLTPTAFSTRGCSPEDCPAASSPCSGARRYGYFAGGRFGTNDGKEVTDEIALNPSHFRSRRTTEQSVSTLVHEMAHHQPVARRSPLAIMGVRLRVRHQSFLRARGSQA